MKKQSFPSVGRPSAGRILTLLTAVNYLNYIDRYILAASLVAIKMELKLSDLQAGLLATSFIMAYVLTTPIFGWFGDRVARPKILAAGVFVWSLATLATGLAESFFLIMAARFILGIGESAFTTTSPSYLCDQYPTEKRAGVLALFSSAIPVGSALGYVIGGWISQRYGWRNAFFVATVPGIVISIAIAFFPEARSRIEAETHYSLKRLLQALAKNSIYIWAVLGYCAYTFTLGALANWMPTYLQRYFELDAGHANTLFGAMAVPCGLAGTLLGGWLADVMIRKSGRPTHQVHLFLSAITVLFAIPCTYICFKTYDLTIFTIAMCATQFLLFVSTSPVNVVILEAVPVAIRTSAMAISIFCIHVLGDAISSPLVGRVSDVTGSLSKGIMVCLPALVACAIFWFLGAFRREAATSVSPH